MYCFWELGPQAVGFELGYCIIAFPASRFVGASEFFFGRYDISNRTKVILGGPKYITVSYPRKSTPKSMKFGV